MSERDDRKVKGGCIPVRRKISSGGKEGSYADARTGGKQAYLALKKSKPPGSAGGWTKKNCICCHKCKNDRSAPNGFVCMNPAHLYWGSKADNTYDQNRGNGWAAENKKSLEENTYLKGEQIMKMTRATLRKLIKETFDQMMSDEELMNIAAENGLGMDQEGEFVSFVRGGMSIDDALREAMGASSDDVMDVEADMDDPYGYAEQSGPINPRSSPWMYDL